VIDCAISLLRSKIDKVFAVSSRIQSTHHSALLDEH